MTIDELTFTEFLERWPNPPGDLAAYAQRGMDGVILAVVADDGTLAGYWPVWHAVHLDGLWLSPDLKDAGPGTLRSLLLRVFATLHANGVQVACAMLPPDGPSAEQGARLGFLRAPGDLYLLQIPAPAAPGA